ncbi:hypothetical protein [Ekhidna sp.]|uniref:hypothetical protein n=1 Tax=Ekhidna sp. TaxID=2608089 RepID=UPI003B50FD34
MTKEKYLEDLKDIKEIMNKSTRFISLSGWSGVMAGSFALIGAYLAYVTVYNKQNYLSYKVAILDIDSIIQLILIAVGVIVLSFATGLYFTSRQAKKQNQLIWDRGAKLLLSNFMIPLVSGGILCLMLLIKGYIGFVAPFTLIFYGLALVNASKYTLSQIKSLGVLEIILGLIATHYIGYGLLFWALGFGLLHIIYGMLIQKQQAS